MKVALPLGLTAVLLAVVFLRGDDGRMEAFAAGAATGQINVTATLTHASGREVGRPGRQSNAVEQSWRLTDRYGNNIGRMLMECRWIRPTARMCYGELTLPLGKLTFLGSSPTSFEGEYAVTGGTGAYRSGGGVMLFTAIGLRKTVLLVTVTT